MNKIENNITNNITIKKVEDLLETISTIQDNFRDVLKDYYNIDSTEKYATYWKFKPVYLQLDILNDIALGIKKDIYYFNIDMEKEYNQYLQEFANRENERLDDLLFACDVEVITQDEFLDGYFKLLPLEIASSKENNDYWYRGVDEFPNRLLVVEEVFDNDGNIQDVIYTGYSNGEIYGDFYFSFFRSSDKEDVVKWLLDEEEWSE